MRVILGLGLVLAALWSGSVTSAPMTNADATAAGKLLGQQQDLLTTPLITDATVAAKIPQATATPSETAFFGGGAADNFLPGDNKRIECSTAAPNPDPFAQQACNAVNLVSKAPAQRPNFSISRADPILQREQAVRANASTVAFGTTPAAPGTTPGAGANPNPNGFGIAGTYSACTTTTTPNPAGSTTQTCTDFMTGSYTPPISTCQVSKKATQSCNKTVNITVVQPAPIPATYVASCGAGYTLTGTNCTAPAIAANPNYSCTSGTLSGTQCFDPAYQPAGSAAAATSVPIPWTGGTCASAGLALTRTNTGILCTGGACITGCWVFYGGWITVTPAYSTTYSCPAGYTLSGTTCYPPMITPPPTAATIASYTCQTGSVLSGTTCTPTQPTIQTYTCGAGMTLTGTTCTPAPVFNKTITDNCTNLQAKTI